MLGSVSDGKVALIAGVTADATARIKAGELVNFVAQQVGGKGGGRPTWPRPAAPSPTSAAGAGWCDGVGAAEGVMR